jgi:hypothetical protein
MRAQGAAPGGNRDAAGSTGNTSILHAPADERIPESVFLALRERLLGAPCPGCGGVCGPDSGLGLLIVDGRRWAHLLCGNCTEASARTAGEHARVANAVELCLLPAQGAA